MHSALILLFFSGTGVFTLRQVAADVGLVVETTVSIAKAAELEACPGEGRVFAEEVADGVDWAWLEVKTPVSASDEDDEYLDLLPDGPRSLASV